jgi:hypothetical protein
MLVPVYTTFYRDDENTLQPVYVNGQNGNIFGVKNSSMKAARTWTIAMLVSALIVFTISLLITAGGLALPALFVPGVLGMLFAFILGICSLIPLYLVWHYNRKQGSPGRALIS